MTTESESQALLTSVDYRESLRSRVLRVIFREEKNASLRAREERSASPRSASVGAESGLVSRGGPSPLKGLFRERDVARTGFLSREQVGDCAFALQGRRFLAEQDLRVLCAGFEAEGNPDYVQSTS